MPERDFDLVVYGASGFVGRLVAAHLAEHAPAGTRIGLAGRSSTRVAEVREGLGPSAAGWAVLEADSAEAASLAALAARTRVLATTVGPYARYGMPVVEACARSGTHYADLTGEVLFVRDAIDRTDVVARATGARIVHSCGYDSVPSDLAAHLLSARAQADGAGHLLDVTLTAYLKGGFSGGTIDSARAQLEAVAAKPFRRRVLGDPYALSPDRAAEPSTPQPSDAPPPSRGPDRQWRAPFVMASYNTRIVRRSNALQNWAYGRSLRYGEVMGTGRGLPGALAAVAVTGGLVAALGAMGWAPTRALLDRVLPAPGTGPGEEARRTGWFRSVVDAVTEDGRRYRAIAAGQGDPGYAATAVMLGEAALALVLDTDRLPDRAGSLTPATALGNVLVERLRGAGHTYEVEPA